MTKVLENFLKYVTYETTSIEEVKECPSSKGQLVFGEMLVEELKTIGIKDVRIDKGYIYAFIESNIERKVPKIGFIAHMDTSPDMSGLDVNPKLIKNYQGGDIILNQEDNIVLSEKEFPELKNYIGKDLVTTDGRTLLGADDKAGVAEIIAAMEYLIKSNMPHGPIGIGFTPDEEIGRGADLFDVESFGAKYAYTIDGGTLGELECENFNAAGLKITVKGRNVHPGYAKNKMINSISVAQEFINQLPQGEVPEKTSGYEGFFHLNSMKGNVEETTLSYIIRDFNKEKFEGRKRLVTNIIEKINNKYGYEIIIGDIKDQYYNMREKIEEDMLVVEIAQKAIEEAKVKPILKPIRGGTDGSRLSYMGLPTPNIFTGGENFHGRYEYIAVNSMEKAVDVILKIVEGYTKQ
ncbi:MAG TPA: peptidase T [Clostridiaceae bacterium]